MVPLLNIVLGEVIFGGVGAGLYGMLMFAILAVFIAGLMVGRTPEYLGKKIERYEVKMAMLAVLILAADILMLHGDRGGVLAGTLAAPCINLRPARLLRDPLRLHLGPATTARAFAGLTATRHVLQHRCSASPCSSAASS